MASNLVKLLLEGKTYDWVLRHCQGDDLSPARIREIRKRLAEDGIDLGTLAVLRQLDPCIARSPYPSLKRLDHTQYYFFPIPAFDIEVFFSVFITEHGLELGSELFPKKVDWQFGHREVQYCIGGEVKTEVFCFACVSYSLRVPLGSHWRHKCVVASWPETMGIQTVCAASLE